MAPRNGNYTSQKKYQQLVRAKMYIDTHYGEKLCLKELAALSGYSRFHFLRIFKKVYGLTPLEYITKRRLEQAKFLIQQGASISDACWRVGFESLSTFMGLFKKTTGLPSSGYKEEYARQSHLKSSSPSKFIPSCFLRRDNIRTSNIQDS